MISRNILKNIPKLYLKELQSPKVITSVLITSFLTVWKGIKLALRYFIFGRSQLRFLVRQQIMLTEFFFPLEFCVTTK